MCVERIFQSALWAILASALLATGAGAQTQGTQASQIAAAIESHYRGAKTLQADFLERYSEGGKQERVESGRVFFARPGKMRWEYESPETKLFVSDGQVLWFYVPRDHTATRKLVKQSDDWRTPLALLTGQVKLSRLCGRIDLAGGPPHSDGTVVLRCWPRGEKTPEAAHAGSQGQTDALNADSSGFTEVLLEVNPTSGELSDVRVEQPGGVELEFRFGAWQMNPPLPMSLFKFDPPVGAAIVPYEGDVNASP